MASPTPSLTNPNPKREGANQARHLMVNEPTERAADAIYVHDEDDNDIAMFFHSEHATVGQSYETALRLATMLVEANNGGGAPSPGDPVRAALEENNREHEIEAVAEHLHEEHGYDKCATWPTHPDDDGYRGNGRRVTITPPDVQARLREQAGRILTRVDQLRQRAALSVSTPTGEGEAQKPTWDWETALDTPRSSDGMSPLALTREAYVRATGGVGPVHTPALVAAVKEAMRAALAHPQQGGERDGWKLVPVEPTEEMQSAFDSAYWQKSHDAASPTPTEHPEDGGGPFGYGYRALLGAAPTSPSKSSGEKA